jgi:predicted RNA-binding Zn-ribbon protein involved in translation (DUF1610 family)
MDECYWCGDQLSGDTLAWYCPDCAARELAEIHRCARVIAGKAMLGVIL